MDPIVASGYPIFLMQLKLSEHQTSPPGYLTESELISLMEKHSIGTASAILLPHYYLGFFFTYRMQVYLSTLRTSVIVIMSGWRVAGGWFLQNWALFLCMATRRYQISSVTLDINCNDRKILSQIDPELVLPTMRSAIEEQLSLIAKGKVFIILLM